MTGIPLIALTLIQLVSAVEPRTYECTFSDISPVTDGDLSDPVWQKAKWTEDFVDIRGGEQPAPAQRTRAKMLWTSEGLHIAAELEESHVWGTLTEKNSIIYHDNDFEVFIDPDGDTLNYYEFEINALGTIWELTLDKPYSKGGEAELGTNMPGLKSGVKVLGTLNNPTDTDQAWTIEVFFPWKDLARYRGKVTSPPSAGDTWRINFSRVEWKHEIKDGTYVRIPAHGTKIPPNEHPEDNWVWNPTGEINMHMPEKWGRLLFVR